MNAPGDEPHDGQMLSHQQFLFCREQLTCLGAGTFADGSPGDLYSALLVFWGVVREALGGGLTTCRNRSAPFANSCILTPKGLGQNRASATHRTQTRGSFAAPAELGTN